MAQEASSDHDPVVEWTDARTQKLIEALQTYPCLYNTTLKEYHDRYLSVTANLSPGGIASLIIVFS